MDYRLFQFRDTNWLILRERKTYSRTASGKSWRSRPDETKRTIFSAKQYENFITSIPFFNNFGEGAYCRASWGWEEPGRLPWRVTTVSPLRTTKHVDEFEFLYLPDLQTRAGNREKSILQTVTTWRVWQKPSPTSYRGTCFELMAKADSDGHTDTAVWCTWPKAWVN